MKYFQFTGMRWGGGGGEKENTFKECKIKIRPKIENKFSLILKVKHEKIMSVIKYLGLTS